MHALWAKLQKKYKLLAAVSLIVGVSSAATVGVMAAIPDSATGVISACRNNSNGSLKAIDAQTGVTCGSSETLLAWPSTQPPVAYARFKPTTAAPNGLPELELDTINSKNISLAKVTVSPPPANDPDNIYPYPPRYFYCLKVPFSPKVVLAQANNDFGSREENYLEVVAIKGIASAGDATMEAYCGTGGYNVALSGYSLNGLVHITD